MAVNKLLVACATIALFAIASEAANPSFLRYFLVEKYETNNADPQEKSGNVILEIPLQKPKEVAAAEQKLVDEVLGETKAEDSPQEKVVTTPEDADYKLSYANYDITWKKYKKEHNRSYESPEEEKKRFALFMDNVKNIERHNWQFHNGLTTYWMDINQFSDRTEEELANIMPPLDLNFSDKWGAPYNGTHEIPEGVEVPDAIDWRQQGYVTGVKNQGSCGSCWSFSSTGSLEGQWYRKTRRLNPLSEQQLIDCSGRYGNQGCNGGWMDPTFQYIRDAGGIQSESTYPYRGAQGSCRFNRQLAVAQVRGYSDVSKGNEYALMTAVGTVGPVSVAIAVNSNFQHYRGGIYTDSTCNSGQINHAVLVVGYGGQGSNQYWLVKNSWGTGWGIGGYIYMARNRANMCWIASYGTYPLV